MSVSEQQRMELSSWLEGQMGTERAATLMSMLPPAGWGDVATKHDVLALDRQFGEIDRRFGEVDRRFEEVDRRFDQIDRRFEQVDLHFEQVERRFDQIDGHLARLDGRIDGVGEQIQAATRTYVRWLLSLHAITLGVVGSWATLLA